MSQPDFDRPLAENELWEIRGEVHRWYTTDNATAARYKAEQGLAVARVRIVRDEDAGGYGYQRIQPSAASTEYHFRIHDARDNAICFCYLEEHAQQVVRGLNRARPVPPASGGEEEKLLRAVLVPIVSDAYRKGRNEREWRPEVFVDAILRAVAEFTPLSPAPVVTEERLREAWNSTMGVERDDIGCIYVQWRDKQCTPFHWDSLARFVTAALAERGGGQ